MSSPSENSHLSKDDYKTIDVNDPETRKYLSQSGHGNYSRGRSSHKETHKETHKEIEDKDHKRDKKDRKDRKERQEKQEKQESKEEKKERKERKEERREERREERKDKKKDKEDKDKPFKEGYKEKSYKPDDLLGILSPVESNDHSEEESEKIEEDTRRITKDDKNDTEVSVGKDEAALTDFREDDEENERESDPISGSSSNSESDFSNESEDESEDENDDYDSEESVDTFEMVRELLGDFLITSQEHAPVFERDERGRHIPPRHKNVADLLQELVYLQMGKHRK